jgi:hypothetical protein
MKRSRGSKSLMWSELAGLALLASLFVLGLAATGRTVLQSLVTGGFGVGFFCLVWLMQWTIRRGEAAPPLTGRQKAWNAAVFVLWAAAMAAIGWGWNAGVFE